MVVISLDQALVVTGVAIFDDKKLIHYDTINIKKSLPIEVRLAELQQKLSDLYYEYEFKHLVFEGIQQQSNAETFKKLAYVQAAVMLWCYFNSVKYTVLSPSEWRALNGGGYGRKREEQKQFAIEKVKEWYGLNVDSDTADAINIGRAYFNRKDNKTSAF